MAFFSTFNSLSNTIVPPIPVEQSIKINVVNNNIIINPNVGSYFYVDNINSNIAINIVNMTSTCKTFYLRLSFAKNNIVINWPENIRWYEISAPMVSTYEDLYLQFTTFNSGGSWISSPLITNRPEVSLANYMMNNYSGNYKQLTDIPDEAYQYFNKIVPTSLKEIFSGCTSLLNVDVSGLSLDNVTSIKGMFNGCRSLTSIDLSSFDTRNIIDMSELFISCESLEVVDISNFDTSSIPNTDKEDNALDFNVGGMFRYCNNLQYIIINSNTIRFVPNTNITGSTGMSSSGFDGTYWFGLGLTAENVKILVPRALLNAYRANAKWSSVGNEFYALEDYTVTRSNGQITVTPKS